MLASPDHLVDVRQLTAGPGSSRERVEDISRQRVEDMTSVLEHVRLIQKQSAHKFKWM